MRVFRFLLILGGLLLIIMFVPVEYISAAIISLAGLVVLINMIRFGMKAAGIIIVAVIALYLIGFVK